MKTQSSNNNRAFTVLELLVVVVTLALLALFLLPAISQANRKANRIHCVSYLKQIGLAARIWSGDNTNQYPMRVYTNAIGAPLFADATNLFRYFQAMSNELSTPFILVCPNDKLRTPATNLETGFDNSHVSYFVGLDADESQPEMLLAGDRNVTNGMPIVNGQLTLTTNQPVGWTMAMHQGNGNAAFADGSVQQMTPSRLRNALAASGTSTNRLLFPWVPPPGSN
ncbi:MAG: hypothetical protein JWR19_2603 [Pedosphaera sp.]|nr:hypothetical protein [Pedosphaera sp.]